MTLLHIFTNILTKYVHSTYTTTMITIPHQTTVAAVTVLRELQEAEFCGMAFDEWPNNAMLDYRILENTEHVVSS